MKIDGKAYRTIWRSSARGVETIDQTRLPHELVFRRIETLDDAVEAIKTPTRPTTPRWSAPTRVCSPAARPP
jgi:methylthioribose-1-phosphate isomerase